jgi:RNA-directed DNA polymerase
MTPAFAELTSWPNLLRAFQRASAGKRGRPSTAAFDHSMADRLLALADELRAGCYQPLPYTHFEIHEPKRRLISAAAFRDRVVHHALCQVIEPRFERVFLPHSFANRVGRGTHAAVAAVQAAAKAHRWVLRADIRQHFPSIDHALLMQAICRHVPEPDVLALVACILASGDGVDADASPWIAFEGDDLLAACRPRGLPIGNLTSQFWSNVYLHPVDLFIQRELRCPGYARYVDDFALFSNSKAELWGFKAALSERLASLRLALHEGSLQVAPTSAGIPWLGFVVYPTHRLVKARKVRHSSRRLGDLYEAWRAGEISFASFDAAVQGWVAHVQHASSWGLRRHVLGRFDLRGGRREREGA